MKLIKKIIFLGALEFAYWGCEGCGNPPKSTQNKTNMDPNNEDDTQKLDPGKHHTNNNPPDEDSTLAPNPPATPSPAAPNNSRPSGSNPGLANVGNSCFCNAVLQCLYTFFKDQLPQDVNPTAKHLRNIFQKMSACNEKSVEGSDIKDDIKEIRTKFFNNDTSQEDAEELIRKILEECPDCGNSFKIEIVKTLLCLKDKSHQSSHTLEKWNNILLPLTQQGPIEIDKLLNRLYTHAEIVQGRGCPVCGEQVNVTSAIKIKEAPQNLMIHLGRFSFDNTTGQSSKIDFIRVFDEDLTLERGWFIDPNATQDVKYSLCGVIMHKGTANNGHYWSYCKNDKGEWFKYDDSDVMSTTFEEFKNEAWGQYNSATSSYSTTSAYILFYKKN